MYWNLIGWNCQSLSVLSALYLVPPTFPVDHYKRKAVRYYEEAPPLANEMRVTTAGRTTDWVRKASVVLEVRTLEMKLHMCLHVH